MEERMSDRIYVGTRKGLFELGRRASGWEIIDAQFLGDPVTAVLSDADSQVYAALDLGHFGAKLWRRAPASKPGAVEWREIAVPVFPPNPAGADDDPHPW